MPELALILLGVFTSVVIAGRIALHYASTGHSGVAALNKKPSGQQRITVMLFLAASAATVSGTALQAAGSVDPVGAVDTGPIHVVATVVWVFGFIIAIAAQRQMGRSWRLGADESAETELVTTGLFAIVRNPIFTGILVATAGVTLLAPNVVTLAGLLLLLATFEVETRVIEEPHLRDSHGASYERYARKVGRFVPHLGFLK